MTYEHTHAHTHTQPCAQRAFCPNEATPVTGEELPSKLETYNPHDQPVCL